MGMHTQTRGPVENKMPLAVQRTGGGGMKTIQYTLVCNFAKFRSFSSNSFTIRLTHCEPAVLVFNIIRSTNKVVKDYR